ncbi:type III-A CRISPR-associated RAMP protein Csm5 [Geoglobus acetivorans]|uniref:CRISPR system Cms protein Csm5 n=1 Tax=Geoglobus acetivorans TaxID=565033 RepID=A0ABZ3H0G7_GEOAI|nr:type III-A CRISPR-associated RAMP protein Csm5 [Geoglobus acetivorans]
MRLEILTPTHIGSGDKYLAIDYVIKRDRVIFIDSMKFFEEIEKMGFDAVDVASKIGRGEKSIEDYVSNISKIKVREAPFFGRFARKEILMHIRTCGKPYIPGSSIKGAIRTAFLWKEVKENRSLLDWTIHQIKNELRGKRYLQRKDLTKLDDNLERKVFRKTNLSGKDGDPKNDLLRALRISDSAFFDSCSVYQINYLGMRNFSVLAECVDSGQKTEVEIDVDEFTLQYLNQKVDLDSIASASREFAEEVVKAETSRGYPEEVKREFRNVLEAKGIILRIGWGTGWYSSTIGTLLKTHPEFEGLRRKLGLGRNPRTNRFSRNFPLIRRVTSDNKPLGWVSIHD